MAQPLPALNREVEGEEPATTSGVGYPRARTARTEKSVAPSSVRSDASWAIQTNPDLPHYLWDLFPWHLLGRACGGAVPASSSRYEGT